MPISKRTILLRCAGAVTGLFAVCLIAGIVAGYLSASGVAVDVGAVAFWVIAPVAVVVMAGAIWIGAMWMRSIDEAAREAHKAAWYWGGSGGMAVGGVLMILSSLPMSETLTIATWLPGRTDPAAYAATGAFALMSLMMIGYGVVWTWWWLARR